MVVSATVGPAGYSLLGRSSSTIWRSLSTSPRILSMSKRRFALSVVGEDELLYTMSGAGSRKLAHDLDSGSPGAEIYLLTTLELRLADA